MSRRPTARELEGAAAKRRAPSGAPPLGDAGEALAMLVRRGFHPLAGTPDVPFPPDLDGAAADRIGERLGHYAFRLFLRGAIQRPSGFLPKEATRYVKPAQARELAESLVALGLAVRMPRRRFRLIHPTHSFGGTLEWYVARELRRRLGFDVATGVKLGAKGVGGDLDVVAAAEGKLVYIELKSSPPRHLSEGEVAAFFDRAQALRPDLALFVLDTALRLADKVVPMLAGEMGLRGMPVTPRRLEREIWALARGVYAVNARHDLVANVGRAIAEGFLAHDGRPLDRRDAPE